jgi:two-component system response regulator NreC
MNEKKRIIIVENHALLRDGLRVLLTQDSDLEVVSEADNGRDAIHLAGKLRPHLVIMDLSMPGMNGIEAIKTIKQREAGIRVLVLTMHRTEEYLNESMRAGADGYVLKDATHQELRRAIHEILDGNTYVSPEVSGKVISHHRGVSSPWDLLTTREREILKLVAEGHSNKCIATYLFLSVKTVEKHRSNLMKKLDMHNSSSLTAYAIEMGLVNISKLPNDASANT